MANIKYPKNTVLGSSDIKAFPKKQYEKITEVIDKVNAISSETSVLKADTINAVTTSGGIATTGSIIEKHTGVAINATATATAAQILTGYITSTSAAAVALTLPTATELGTALGASAGTSFEFIVDNTAGANTVTVTVAAGITAITSPITGGATLTVSTANAVGVFRLVFQSATACKILRIA